jgi:DNA-binding response OmpR family regulator
MTHDDYKGVLDELRTAIDRADRIERRLRGVVFRGEVPADEITEIRGLRVNRRERRVTLHDQPVRLTSREFTLLATLASEPTRLWTKAQLLEVFGYPRDVVRSSRTVDCHASRLRSKLGGAFVVNVWGEGYRLVDDAAMAVA